MAKICKPAYRIGNTFKLSADALENYGETYAETIHTVRAVYDHHVKASDMATHRTGHPGFDANGGSYLYGSELPFDLYEWEMEPA